MRREGLISSLSAMCLRATAALVALVAFTSLPARAIDRTWTGAGDGQTWSDPLNWSDDAVPGPDDHALITRAGTYTVLLTAAASVARLTLGGPGSAPTLDATGFVLGLGAGPSAVEASAVLVIGGVPDVTSDALTLAGPLAVDGRLDWTNGQLYSPSNAYVVTVGPSGLMRWRGTAERTLQAALDVRGTLRWEAGRTRFTQGYAQANSGLFEIANGADVEFIGVGTNNVGPWLWTNTGTVRKSGAGTATFTQVELQTTGGQVDVQGGALTLGFGTRWDDAAVAVAAGATLRLGGTQGNTWHEVFGTLTGTPAGDVILGGTATPGPGLVAPDGGAVALGGTGLQVAGSSLGGRFTGSVYEAAPTNRGLVRFVGDGDTFVSGSFRNEGTARWESGALFYDFVGAIANAGLFEMAPATDQSFLTSGVNGLRPGPFVNTGTVRKSGPATVTTNLEFDHLGAAVDVTGGTLRVQWGGRFEDATLTVAAGATLQLETGGPATIVAGTLSGMAGGAFVLRGRVLLADAAGGRIDIGGTGLALGLNGSLGGDPDGQGMRPAPVNGGLVRFADADATVGGAFRNEGTMRWETGLLRFSPGLEVTNAGLFEIAADGQTLEGASFFAGSTLTNTATGTVRKSGSGTVTILQAITNHGRLAVAGGTLRIVWTGYNYFTNAFAGVVAGVGTLDVDTLPEDRLVNVGRTAPGPGDDGAGIGTLTWMGPFVPGPQARLAAEVGPGAAGQPGGDRLAVNGPASLGTLQVLVRTVGGYAPAVGDAFEVVTATGGVTPVDTVQTLNPAGNVIFLPDYTLPTVVALRAETGQPTAPVVVSPSPLVNGGRRTATLFGDGLAAGSDAFLVCAPCLVGGSRRIAGETLGTVSGGVEVRFDLTSAEILGDYTLVVSAGADSLRAPVRVVPYVSVPLVLQSGPAGLVVRPASSFGSTFVTVYNATNSAEGTIFRTQFDPPSPAVHFAASNLLTLPALPATAPDFFLPVAPGLRSPTTVPFRAGVEPADVLFPGQTPGAGANLPFGSPQPVETTASGFVAPDQFARAFADLMRQTAADLGGAVDDAPALAAARLVVADLLDGGPLGASGDGVSHRSLFGDITGVIPTVLGPVGSSVLEMQPGVVLPPGFAEQLTQIFAANQEMLGRAAVCTVQTQHPAPTVAELQNLADTAGDLNSAQQAQLDAVIEHVGNLREPAGRGGCPGSGDVSLTLQQPIRAALDPNDKSAPAPFGCELTGDGVDTRCARTLVPLASATEPLDYTVQFENVAAATGDAETVTVTDVLDPSLDPATFEVLSSTADSLLTTTVIGQTVTFTFAGIDLPPNQTPPEGQGAVTFRVRPRSGLADGTEIRNLASIVFDFNPPIVTPEVVHVVRATAVSGVTLAAPAEAGAGVPFSYTATVANASGADPAEAAVLTVPVPLGATLVSATTSAGTCAGTTTLTCALGTLDSGTDATVTVTVTPTSSGTLTLTASLATATFDGTWYDDADAASVLVATVAGEGGPAPPTEVVLDGNRPNPFMERTTFRVGLPAASPVSVTVVDLLGREVRRAADGPMDAGWHEVTVEARGLAAGVYVAVLRAGSVVRTRRILVVR